MKRVTLNALVDIGCLISFIPSLLSGLVLYLYLPEGRGLGQATFFGITRTQWVAMHDYTSLIFAALLILHLLLHVNFFRHINRAFRPGAKEPCDPVE